MLHCPDVCPTMVRSVIVILGIFDISSVGLRLSIHVGWTDVTKVRLTSGKQTVSPDSHFDPGSPDLPVCDSQENVCGTYLSSSSSEQLSVIQSWTHVFINFLPLADTWWDPSCHHISLGTFWFKQTHVILFYSSTSPILNVVKSWLVMLFHIQHLCHWLYQFIKSTTFYSVDCLTWNPLSDIQAFCLAS